MIINDVDFLAICSPPLVISIVASRFTQWNDTAGVPPPADSTGPAQTYTDIY